MSAWAAVIVAATFVCLAALHGYWGLGGVWPGHDRESLAQSVVGAPAMPGAGACWLVAAGLVVAAATVLGAAGLVRLPASVGVLHWVAILGATVFALRGLLGFFHTQIRPSTVGSPFSRLNVRFYSPLCLLLALLGYLSVR